jgi:hypothetical protein
MALSCDLAHTPTEGRGSLSREFELSHQGHKARHFLITKYPSFNSLLTIQTIYPIMIITMMHPSYKILAKQQSTKFDYCRLQDPQHFMTLNSMPMFTFLSSIARRIAPTEVTSPRILATN